MDGARRELFACSAVAVNEDVRRGLGGERDLIAELPRRRRFAEDSERVRFAEGRPRFAREVAKSGERMRARDAIEQHLPLEEDRVAGGDGCPLRRDPVDEERTATDAFDLDAGGKGTQHELTPRYGAPLDGIRRFERLGSLAEESYAVGSAVVAPP